MPGTIGCLPFRLLSQMLNSQGGSSAASLFSSFSTDAESRGEAPVALGGVLLELFSVGSSLKGGSCLACSGDFAGVALLDF